MDKLHCPVLLDEAIEGLKIKPSGIYLDGTFGRGGHSRAILDRLDRQGRLLALDRDEAAIDAAQSITDPRFAIYKRPFSELLSVCEEQGVAGKIDGILLDIGVSSPQLDDPERGFSFDKDGPLDMRMDRSAPVSAADLVNTLSKTELSRIFKEYGEERFAAKVAGAIVREREHTPFSTTLQLSALIERVIPGQKEHKHKATRCFQALRIAVNAELDELKAALNGCLQALNRGGRICVISFHSLEDRIVKNFFRVAAEGQSTPPGLPLTYAQAESIRKATATLKLVGGPCKASSEEQARNVRSRSAILRVAEKI